MGCHWAKAHDMPLLLRNSNILYEITSSSHKKTTNRKRKDDDEERKEGGYNQEKLGELR